MLSTLLYTALATSFTAALPVDSQPPYTCHDFAVQIPLINITTTVIPVPEIESQYQATYYANLISTRNIPGNPPPQSNFTTLTKTFNITGQYCTPSNPGPKANTLQLLTHGIGFNATYWNFYLPSNATDTQYSYIHSALTAGYSTLVWNRLGTNGPASAYDPYTEIQGNTELAILAAITKLAVAGDTTLTGLSSPKAPSQLVHVGHSWGSILTKALAINYPSLTNAVVLTGYSDNFSFQPFFPAATSYTIANQNQPDRFPASAFSNGFLSWANEFANQWTFLRYPKFDPAVLAYSEATKQPYTLGMFESVQQLLGNATDFDGKVYYLASEYDVLFCGGQCVGITQTADGVSTELTNLSWPNAKSIDVGIVEGVGHGLNLHYGADKAYARVMEWVGKNFG